MTEHFSDLQLLVSTLLFLFTLTTVIGVISRHSKQLFKETEIFNNTTKSQKLFHIYKTCITYTLTDFLNELNMSLCSFPSISSGVVYMEQTELQSHLQT